MSDKEKPLSNWLGEISIITYVLVALFAISSWIDINGVWVEIPLLVAALPESWNLPSYLVVIIQIANVGPLVYTIAKKLAPNKVKEWHVTYLIISIGAVSCLLLSFFWDVTTTIDGTEHSVALLTLCAFLSLVDCTSSVVYLPYMARFPAQYLTAFYVGEGLSGLIPALIGLGQGIGRDPDCVNRTVENNDTSRPPEYTIEAVYDPPAFSVSTYFLILFGLLCVSALSFTAVHFHPHCRRQRVTEQRCRTSPEKEGSFPQEGGTSSTVDDATSSTIVDVISVDDEHKTPSQVDSKPALTSGGPSSSSSVVGDDSTLSQASRRDSSLVPVVNGRRRRFDFVLLVLMIGWVNALTNGVLPSLQSYSCLPYGNLAYSLAVRLSVAVNPLACFLALFFQVRSVPALGLLTSLGTVLAGYHIALASLSPTPPLVDTDAGAALAVTTFVLLTAFFSYFKVCVAARLASVDGASGLLWCGCSTQIGSLIGAIVTFLLVNVFELFITKYPCT